MLTLLTLTRAFSLSSNPELSTITDQWSGSDCITDREFMVACKVLRIGQGSVGSWQAYHVSTKRGPQGQALLTALSELTQLPSELISDIKRLGGSCLSDQMEQNTEGLDILEAIRSTSKTGGAFFSIA